MARISIISISEGRAHVPARNAEFIAGKQAGLVESPRSFGHEVEAAPNAVSTNVDATAIGRQTADSGVDLTLLYYTVWSFPHFTMLTAATTPGPLTLVASTDPTEPGLVSMLAAGGALDQIGRYHTRLWGEPDARELARQIGARATAAAAVRSPRGSTFGRFGGRPMGMNTAVANTDQWMRQFGIDVEEIDQYELVRRAELADAREAAATGAWPERYTAGVHYEGAKPTRELRDRQIRSYLAVRELIAEHHLDFSGIKGQPGLTEHFATMDITEAFLNDPTTGTARRPSMSRRPRRHGRRTDHAADASYFRRSGAVRRRPALPPRPRCLGPLQFGPTRHLVRRPQHRFDGEPGQGPPVPEVVFFPAGGASAAHIAAPGQMTLGRLSRERGEYRLQLMPGEFVEFDRETTDALVSRSTPEWPPAFARLDAPADVFLSRFGANHIHAIPGDRRAELCDTAKLLGIRPEEWSRSEPRR